MMCKVATYDLQCRLRICVHGEVLKKHVMFVADQCLVCAARNLDTKMIVVCHVVAVLILGQGGAAAQE